MFTRVLRRLLFANRGRLFVILLALSAGAAVSAALLNLQTDAKRRLTTEFRAFGPNGLIVPPEINTRDENLFTFSEKTADRAVKGLSNSATVALPFLSSIASVQKAGKSNIPEIHRQIHAVATGTYLTGSLKFLLPELKWFDPVFLDYDDARAFTYECILGKSVATELHAQEGDSIEVFIGAQSEKLKVFRVVSTGGSLDNQILMDLHKLQHLAGKRDQVSMIQINFAGTPREISDFYIKLASQLPELEVHPLRQFSEAQAKIYSRISGLLTAATALILTLTIFCVMAAMTNIAAERRNDVGMMKAIGGSARSVLNLFLTEAVVLGFAGGLIGAAVGIALSIVLGKAVFGVAAAPRLIVYPISVALTVLVAIFGAYPLRRLVNIRPATVFRGEA